MHHGDKFLQELATCQGSHPDRIFFAKTMIRRWKRVIAFVLMTLKSVGGLSPKKVAVIGASGRLGRRAVDQLVSRKIPCKCLVRGETPPDFLVEHQKTQLVEVVNNGDVTNPESIKTLLQGCSHCLALHGAVCTTPRTIDAGLALRQRYVS